MKNINCNDLIQQYFDDYQERKQQHTNVNQVLYRQDMLKKDGFDEAIINQIKNNRFDEIWNSKININYNLIQSKKLFSCSSLSPLTNDDIKKVLNDLQQTGNKKYDPGDTILFFCKCIEDITNMKFQFDKSQQHDVVTIENANYGFVELNDSETKIRGSKTQEHIVHNEIHNLLFHLSFEHNLIFTVCFNCNKQQLGKYEMIDNRREQPFYCYGCWDQYEQRRCTQCSQIGLGCNDEDEHKTFYCFLCWNGYSLHVPYRHRPTSNNAVLTTAHKKVTETKNWGQRRVIIKGIKKSCGKDVKPKKIIYTRFYALHQIIKDGYLSQHELFAIMIKHGIGTLLLYSLHCIKELKKLKLANINGWITDLCNDEKSSSFSFQQISLNWHQDFNVFWQRALKNDLTSMNEWKDVVDMKIEARRHNYYFGDSPDILKYLSLICNILKHYNTMFEPETKQNEYGIWLKVLKHFKGFFRLIVKFESCLQSLINENRDFLKQHGGQHVIGMMRSLKEDLGVLYDLTKCCSEDYVGYYLFIFGLKGLKKRDHAVFYKELIEENKNDDNDDEYKQNDIECDSDDFSYGEDQNALKHIDQCDSKQIMNILIYYILPTFHDLEIYHKMKIMEYFKKKKVDRGI